MGNRLGVVEAQPMFREVFSDDYDRFTARADAVFANRREMDQVGKRIAIFLASLARFVFGVQSGQHTPNLGPNVVVRRIARLRKQIDLRLVDCWIHRQRPSLRFSCGDIDSLRTRYVGELRGRSF